MQRRRIYVTTPTLIPAHGLEAERSRNSYVQVSDTLKGERDMTARKSDHREPYTKPEMVRHDNLKDITFECPAWQCSVTVPPAPQA